MLMEHGAFVRWLNSYSNPSFDLFFRWVTHLGDGLFAVVLILLFLLFYKVRLGLGLLLAFISSGIISQVVKRIIAAPRPRSYFPDFESLNLIPDLYYSSSFSFPSGHTATAFAVFTFMALMTKNRLLQFAYLVIAIIIGISRVYLLQHFLIDITVGAFLGVCCGFIAFLLLAEIDKPFLNNSGFELFKNSNNKKAQP